MIYSNRTYSHNDIKKLIKTPVNNPGFTSRKPKIANQQNYQQMDGFVEVIREHELQILELRNDLLKKQIELKEKAQKLKDIEKQVTGLRRQKEMFAKTKQKFEIQRQTKNYRIEELEEINQQMKNKLNDFRPPKDRYETCMRQLDELKLNIQSKEDVVKERDLYKYFYEEIKQLVVSTQFSAEEVRNNLKSFFIEMDQKFQKSN